MIIFSYIFLRLLSLPQRYKDTNFNLAKTQSRKVLFKKLKKLKKLCVFASKIYLELKLLICAYMVLKKKCVLSTYWQIFYLENTAL